MINPDLALGASFEPVPFAWSADDVIRYHLALGAGSPTCDGTELQYVFEDVLTVLGTFAVVPASAASAVAAVGPGLSYNPTRIVHGEHHLALSGVLPAAGTSLNRARVAGVYDKGRSAVVDIEVETEVGGQPVARNTFRLLLPDEGGFGGAPGPARTTPLIDRPADAVFQVPTLPQQAALYRMTGDRTPLHIDPETARRAGFPRPTLPGLCTWGMVAKALVDRELDGAGVAMTGFGARFAGPVYPGETLAVSVWRGAREHAISATVLDRDTPALSHGRFAFTS